MKRIALSATQTATTKTNKLLALVVAEFTKKLGSKPHVVSRTGGRQIYYSWNDVYNGAGIQILEEGETFRIDPTFQGEDDRSPFTIAFYMESPAASELPKNLRDFGKSPKKYVFYAEDADSAPEVADAKAAVDQLSRLIKITPAT